MFYFPDFIIASPKSEIQPVIGIDEVGYSPLLLGNAEGSFYNVVILRACNLNSNYRLGVKWNIGLTSSVPLVIRNDRSTFHRF